MGVQHMNAFSEWLTKELKLKEKEDKAELKLEEKKEKKKEKKVNVAELGLGEK